MGRFRAFVVTAAALIIAASAVVLSRLVPQGDVSASTIVGTAWFATGAFALLVAAALVVRMKLRTTRAARVVVPNDASAINDASDILEPIAA